MSVYIPAKVRGPIYIGYGIVGTGLGATQVGFATANVDQPVWLTVALSVFAFLGTAIGYTAASNTPVAPSEGRLTVVNPVVDIDAVGRAIARHTPPPYAGDSKLDATFHGKHE